jgi:hypothetical protein
MSALNVKVSAVVDAKALPLAETALKLTFKPKLGGGELVGLSHPANTTPNSSAIAAIPIIKLFLAFSMFSSYRKLFYLKCRHAANFQLSNIPCSFLVICSFPCYTVVMMMLEQTIEISESRRIHLDLDLPNAINLGAASVLVTINPLFKGTPPKNWRMLRGFFKSDGHAVDRFLESRMEEKRIEDEKDERQMQTGKRHKQ